MEIDKQKRARDDEGAFIAHHRCYLLAGVIIGFAGKSSAKHARIIQQEFHCAKLNEKLQGPCTE